MLHFVPPFPGSIAKILGPKSPFYRHGDLVPFIAYRDGKIVGRIAAIENRAHNKYYQDKIGFFGFFDAIDDAEVANCLFEAVKTELKKRGLEKIRGPYSPTVNDECGLLVQGFESSPFVLMPFNPPYYVHLVENYGFEKARDLVAFYLPATIDPPEKMVRIVERFKKNSQVTIRNINMKRLSDDLKIIQRLYNDTLVRNWGFIPLTVEDLEFAAEDLKAFVQPDLVLIAEKDGEPVGFSLLLPNINELMFRVKNSNSIMRVLKFIWHLKINPPKEARLAVLGVRPEFQLSGVAPVFYYETIIRGKKRFIGAECSWIDESNAPMMRSLELMGAKPYKNYRIYEKAL